MAKKKKTALAKRQTTSPTLVDQYALQFGSAWDYAPAPEATDHVKIKPRYELFIGGEWRAPRSKKYFDTISPSTEKKLSEIAEANEKLPPLPILFNKFNSALNHHGGEIAVSKERVGSHPRSTAGMALRVRSGRGGGLAGGAAGSADPGSSAGSGSAGKGATATAGSGKWARSGLLTCSAAPTVGAGEEAAGRSMRALYQSAAGSSSVAVGFVAESA